MQYELKTRQVCLFLIALMPLTKLFLMPSVLAEHANEDMWISALINCALDFVTLICIIRLCRLANTNVFGIIESAFGKVGAKIFFGLYAVYFLLKAVIPLNEQKDFVVYTLYTLMPILMYFLPFFVLSFYFCTKNLRAVGRAADVLWFITLAAFAIIIPLSIANIDPAAILPIGANGVVKITSGSYSVLTWFGDAAYFLFFAGEFKYSKGDGKKIILSYLLSAAILILFLLIFYAAFTSIASRQRFALTEISKYTTVINSIGRFDYLGIFMILFSNLFSLTMPMFITSKILNYIFGFSKKWISPLIAVGTQALLMIAFYRFIFGIENFIMQYCGLIFIIFGNVIPIAVSLLYKKEKVYESAQS